METRCAIELAVEALKMAKGYNMPAWDAEKINKALFALLRATPPPSSDAIRLAVEALENARGTLASSRHLLTKYCPDHHWLPQHDKNIAAIREQLSALRAIPADQSDHEEVLADHRRLVRELDVLLCGEEGAAKQASLCDIVSMVARWRREGWKTPSDQPDEDAAEALEDVEYAVKNGLKFISIDHAETIRAALQQRVRGGVDGRRCIQEYGDMERAQD